MPIFRDQSPPSISCGRKSAIGNSSIAVAGCGQLGTLGVYAGGVLSAPR